MPQGVEEVQVIVVVVVVVVVVVSSSSSSPAATSSSPAAAADEFADGPAIRALVSPSSPVAAWATRGSRLAGIHGRSTARMGDPRSSGPSVLPGRGVGCARERDDVQSLTQMV